MTDNVYSVYTDLLKQPHLLIAGATGCGKSKFIDGLLFAAMYETPAPILLLIDPKQIDLLKYERLRITARRADNLAGAVEVLKIANYLIDKRFEELKTAGGFLEKSTRPPVFVVCDEIASLTSKLNGKQAGDIINLIIRIVSLGRACNVHFIGATQTIKANILPTELTNNTTVIGLHCRTAGQSRILIGENGCEQLPAHGQAIVNYGNRLEHIKCPLIPADSLRAIIEHWY